MVISYANRCQLGAINCEGVLNLDVLMIYLVPRLMRG